MSVINCAKLRSIEQSLIMSVFGLALNFSLSGQILNLVETKFNSYYFRVVNLKILQKVSRLYEGSAFLDRF